ncbi:MAG: glutamyl-tRNA reductase [Clostridia bacterium]
MNITISGINYKKTPLAIREKLSFDSEEQKKTLAQIQKLPQVKECVMLSTCNRTEVYIYSEEDDFNNEAVEKILSDMKKENLYELKKYFYAYSSVKAVRHLFKVASGLDSMVLGEDQILGQVKSAHHTSLEAGTGSSVLNTLFRDAITAAKQIKTSTELSKNSVSIGSLAVKCILKLCKGELSNQCALVIGTGEIGSIVFKNLCSKGIGKVYITNRSHGKLEDLSRFYRDAHLLDYEQRYSVMDECDIVISSTTSPHYTIARDMLEKSFMKNKERIFIDLAVPRDIDESIREVDGLKYYNMDHLKSVLDENLDRRMLEAVKAEEIIDRYVIEYEKWYEFRKALPVVKDVQRYAEALLREKVETTIGKLRCASDEDKETVRISITNTVNEIMNKFIYSIKENGSKDDIKAYFTYLKDIVKENA